MDPAEPAPSPCLECIEELCSSTCRCECHEDPPDTVGAVRMDRDDGRAPGADLPARPAERLAPFKKVEAAWITECGEGGQAALITLLECGHTLLGVLMGATSLPCIVCGGKRAIQLGIPMAAAPGPIRQKPPGGIDGSVLDLGQYQRRQS